MRRLAGAAVLAIAAAVAAGAAWRAFERPGPLTAETVVVVPQGNGLRDISRLLSDAGVIRDSFLFTLGVRVSGLAGSLRAGEFAFAPKMSMREVARHLAAGEIVTRRLMVPEGLTARAIVSLVENAGGLSGRASVPAAEGAFLPETYFYSWGDTRDSILRRMAAAMAEALREAWDARKKGLSIRTPEEALVLASMIEKETGVGAERARISAVFHNRLRRGMRLQSDPTVVYAITHGRRPLGRKLTRADLAVDSPYNTYARRGLPPAPISSPGRAALRAAVRPSRTGDLYFVADGSGGHKFARTLREHNRNVAEWRRRMKNR